MQYGKSVDGYFSARERFELEQFAALEAMEPRLLLSAVPKIRIKNTSVLEGDAGTFNRAIFEVVRRGPASALNQVTRVRYTTALTGAVNAAVQGADFLAKSGVIRFKPGQKRQTINVTIVGNNIQQPDRSFSVRLTEAKGAKIQRRVGFGIINDDDGAGPQSQTPTIRISDVSQNEGNAGLTPFVFNVTLSSAHDKTVTVDFQTSNGTAKAADNDYQPTNGTLTFLPGETSKNITVNVIGDTKPELDESFIVNLSKASNGIIVKAAGVGKILNDDGNPSLRINDVSILEGNPGQITKAVFTVSLTGQLDEELTINYVTADGTATAGVDYVATSGTLVFAPGETTKTIEVDVLGDALVEPDETFFVNLNNPSLSADKVVVTTSSGKGTILNDDIAPVIRINDVTKNEGNAGTTPFVFEVTLDKPAVETVTVDFVTADGTARVGDADYVAQSGTLTFLPGETLKTITVSVNGDTKDEPDEDFYINLSNPTKATIADGQGRGVIVNDDLLPTVTITDESITEGNAGQKLMTFNVSLSAPSGKTVTVVASTAPGTAMSSDNDYVTKSQTITFLPGQTSQPFTVVINGDTKPEPDEIFFVNLSSPTNATLAPKSQGIGTIINDDQLPFMVIDDVTKFEGNPTGGQTTTEFRFKVRLSVPATQEVRVNYTTQDGAGGLVGVGNATIADQDYVSQAGTLIFSPGQQEKEIVILVNRDTKPEADEAFRVVLSGVVNATLQRETAFGFILDDDPVFASVNDVAVTEGNAGTKLLTFTVSLNTASERAVTVDFATSDGTATAGVDYEATAGTLIFQPGQLTRTVSVTINGDTALEPDEFFNLVLTNPSTGLLIEKAVGIGTILNDD
jgi:hypothetical protein